MQLEKIILLMGPPGSGKGTQSRLLVSKLNSGYFSMGDTLREYAKQDSDLGREIKEIIDRGAAVYDEIATRVFEDSFAKKVIAKDMVIDGYPRSMGQVESLNKALSGLRAKDVKLILLDVDKQKLMDRLQARSQKEARADDADIASIEKRFSEYETKTSVAREYYQSQGELIHINGDQSIEKVHEDIMEKLQ